MPYPDVRAMPEATGHWLPSTKKTLQFSWVSEDRTEELVKIIKNLNLSDRQGLQTPDRLSTTVVTKKMTGENLMKSQPTFHLSRFLPEPSFPSETLEKGDNDLNTEERLRRSLSRFIIQERKRKILANHIKIWYFYMIVSICAKTFGKNKCL